MTSDDKTRIDEIRAWFDESGYDLYIHEVEGHGWRAPYLPKDARIASAGYGFGDTPLAAAEDARARYTRENGTDVMAAAFMPIEVTGGVSSSVVLSGEVEKTQLGKTGQTVEIGPCDRNGHAQPITPSKTKTVGPAVETSPGVELPDAKEKERTLTTYGWRVLFEDEPDEKVTGRLLDLDSGETLKAALGNDFEDAWLGLGVDTTPPSVEVRREREQRRSEDSST
jgi:hypothetical protein